MFQLDLEKAEEPEIRLPTSAGSQKKPENSRKTSTPALLTMDCVDHNKLWKILQEMGIQDHLIQFLRNLYAGQEATVRTAHGTTDWFQIWKGVCQGCILSPCLFDLYAEYITRNAGLDEAQNGINIASRNINNLRSADDTILMAESEEQLKSLLTKVKEESEKADSALTLRVNLIPLPNFVDNQNPKILDLADKFVQFISVTQSYPTLCDPMDYSTPGLPVHHQLPEFTQIHVH